MEISLDCSKNREFCRIFSFYLIINSIHAATFRKPDKKVPQIRESMKEKIERWGGIDQTENSE